MDVRIDFHGSINLVHALTAAAQDWVDEHLPEDATRFGDAVVVEPRYTRDIVEGMIDDGLAVFSGGVR
jgi:hypothetical protein